MTSAVSNASSFTHIPEMNLAVVQRAEFTDANEIFEVLNAAFKRDFFRDPNIHRCPLEKIKEYFSDSTHTWYVIKAQTKTGITEIAGAVLYSTDQAPETAKEGNIHMLAARPSYWGKKISLALLSEVEKRAIQDGKSSIALVVMNACIGLIEFYKKLGYRLTGETYEIPSVKILPQYREKDANEYCMIHALRMVKELTSFRSML